MGNYIPEDVLRTIKGASNIRQVVEEYVALKKAGRNWVGLCPFHPDKDPSFSVSEERQIFYCFGCGEGGDVFKFLMKIQGMSFTEAVKHLANRYGIPIPERPLSPSQRKRRQRRNTLLELNELAAEYFHQNLVRSRHGQRPMEYLAGRGITRETIDRFRLGWALDSWDGLIGHIKARGMDLEAAVQAGLVVERQGGKGHYDRFRARITFPILDGSGRVAAIGGRLIGDGHPKYLNSPETPVYHKSRVLYGFYRNKGAIRRARRGYIVEGYMDLLALVQAGIDQVVATLGTALTGEHAALLRSLAEDWILVFDSDSAGQKAALRALPILYGHGIRPRVMPLPEGHDPDTFIRLAGPDQWHKRAEECASGIDYALEHYISSLGQDPEGKAGTIDQLQPLLESVRDPIRRSLLVGHVAHRVGVREEDLWQRLRPQAIRGRRPGPPGPLKLAVNRPSGPRANRAEHKVLGFLLAHPHYMPEFVNAGLELWLEDKALKDLFSSMTHVYSMAEALDVRMLMEHLLPRPEVRDLARRLKEEFPPCETPELMGEELMRYCEERKKKALRMELIEQLRNTPEEEGQEELLKQLERLR